jgi:hypothetical protein
MKRRTVLAMLSAAAAGRVLGGNRSAWGQAPSRGAIDSRGGSPSVSTRDIRIGMSAA